MIRIAIIIGLIFLQTCMQYGSSDAKTFQPPDSLTIADTIHVKGRIWPSYSVRDTKARSLFPFEMYINQLAYQPSLDAMEQNSKYAVGGMLLSVAAGVAVGVLNDDFTKALIQGTAVGVVLTIPVTYLSNKSARRAATRYNYALVNITRPESIDTTERFTFQLDTQQDKSLDHRPLVSQPYAKKRKSSHGVSRAKKQPEISHCGGLGLSYGFRYGCFGILGYWTSPYRIGIFAELTGNDDTTLKDNYYSNISLTLAEDTFEDQRTDEEVDLSIFSMGIAFRIVDQITLYLGSASVKEKTYYQYYDPLHILSSSGNYWINSGIREKGSCLTYGAIIAFIDNPTIQAGLQIGYYADPSFLELGFAFAIKKW